MADAFNLLTERLLTIDGAGERTQVALPELLARLSRREPVRLAALQAHQRHAVHAFVVQVAAMGWLEGADEVAGELPSDATAWQALLLGLTEGHSEPWTLGVGDLSRPAFLQPSVPEGSVGHWKSYACADEVDLLITAKLHDVKAARMIASTPEQWMFALISLQTTQGFSGRDNYGVSRMNGGFGNRPGFSTTPSLSWGAQFVRDVNVATRTLPALRTREGIGFAPRGGERLLWLVPWDGSKSLRFSALHPLFVEVCRRVRLLANPDGRFVAYVTSTHAQRVEPGETKGNVGDLWTPVRKQDNAGMTLPKTGFTYQHVAELLFGGKWDLPPAAEVTTTDGPSPAIVARALVRGQGKTEGYHERVIPMKPKVVVRLGQPAFRQTLGARSELRVLDVANVRLKVLKPAILTLFQGAPDKLKFDDDRATHWLEAFESDVDADYFDLLFDAVEQDLDDERAQLEWRRALGRKAWAAFERGRQGAAVPIGRHYRALSKADDVFWGGLMKQLDVRRSDLRADAVEHTEESA